VTSARETPEIRIKDVRLVTVGPSTDNRGSFHIFWESECLQEMGIRFSPWGAYHSYNHTRGTLRGLHFQQPPYGQGKLVTCVSGEMADVIVDLRPDSPTFLQWDLVTLTEASPAVVYVPPGCAHGFQTLRDHTTVAYLIDGAYRPDAAGAVRWNDPAFGIPWPIGDPVLSLRDRTIPDYRK
jgi:dTDP-4-dehydrorhamnose 3,5-epimerase